jgi:hypothetical protein
MSPNIPEPSPSRGRRASSDSGEPRRGSHSAAKSRHLDRVNDRAWWELTTAPPERGVADRGTQRLWDGGPLALTGQLAGAHSVGHLRIVVDGSFPGGRPMSIVDLDQSVPLTAVVRFHVKRCCVTA